MDDTRLKTSLVLSTTSGVISTLGSILIILVLLRSPKKLGSTYRRLVFGMSCMDILHSLVYVAAGLPVPDDELIWRSNNAIGNIATCNVQGFMNYTGLMGSVFYDCMLSIYFIMVVVYSKREDFFQKRIEPLFHAISVLFPSGIGIFLLVTKYFNGVGIVCWIASYPAECEFDPQTKCTRGEHATRFKYYFQYGPLALIALIFFACMIRLSCFITKQFKKMKTYGANEFKANVKKKKKNMQSKPSLSGVSTQRVKRTINAKKSRNEIKQTFTQAMLYISAMVLTLSFPVLRLLTKEIEWTVLALQNFFLPLLGFFNFFIFIRPRIVVIMESKPELSHFQAIIIAITTREIVHASGKRTSMVMSIIRQTPRGSQISLGQVRAAAKLAAEEIKEEITLGLEDGLEVEENDSLQNDDCGLDESRSRSLRNDAEALDEVNFSDEVYSTKAEVVNMTEDYNNML